VWLDGAQLRGTITGILIDVFAGLYFLFQALYGVQQFLDHDSYGYTGCRARYGEPSRPLDECERWRARTEPVIWIYLFVTLVFG
jgi:hypothetical protein